MKDTFGFTEPLSGVKALQRVKRINRISSNNFVTKKH
jgi:hypothetical protein